MFDNAAWPEPSVCDVSAVTSLESLQLNSTLTVRKNLYCNFHKLDMHTGFLALHFLLFDNLDFTDRWRHCNANGMEDLAADTLTLTANSKALSVLFEHCLP